MPPPGRGNAFGLPGGFFPGACTGDLLPPIGRVPGFSPGRFLLIKDVEKHGNIVYINVFKRHHAFYKL